MPRVRWGRASGGGEVSTRDEWAVFIGDPTECPRCGAEVQVKQGFAVCGARCGWMEAR